MMPRRHPNDSMKHIIGKDDTSSEDSSFGRQEHEIAPTEVGPTATRESSAHGAASKNNQGLQKKGSQGVDGPSRSRNASGRRTPNPLANSRGRGGSGSPWLIGHEEEDPGKMAARLARTNQGHHTFKFMQQNLSKAQIMGLSEEQIVSIMNVASTEKGDSHIPLDNLPYIKHLVEENNAAFRRRIGLDPGPIETPISYDGAHRYGATQKAMVGLPGMIGHADQEMHIFQPMHPYGHLNHYVGPVGMDAPPGYAANRSPHVDPRHKVAHLTGAGAGPSNAHAGFMSPYFSGPRMSQSFYQNANEGGPSTIDTVTPPHMGHNIPKYSRVPSGRPSPTTSPFETPASPNMGGNMREKPRHH